MMVLVDRRPRVDRVVSKIHILGSPEATMPAGERLPGLHHIGMNEGHAPFLLDGFGENQ
jgi:hypothetical protein